jgi:large subunit ribosomal protein L24
MKIRKGDTVIVVRGDDKDKTGRVLSVDTKKRTVIVQRVRLAQRHRKPGSQQAVSRGTIEKELAIPISSVALIDPKTGKATRVRLEIPDSTGGDRIAARRGKIRRSIRSKVEIERPLVKQ